ncbi:unnamed protein product [Prorocentrum cordatum]|uniref:Uncharacterized protein n=1 Tax=Prorocentrum cordatum TaxID=2364126 RepID=A0ABN9QIU6_9DINO|nr:unnamed protein product [Polarella glacialis]
MIPVVLRGASPRGIHAVRQRHTKGPCLGAGHQRQLGTVRADVQLDAPHVGVDRDWTDSTRSSATTEMAWRQGACRGTGPAPFARRGSHVASPAAAASATPPSPPAARRSSAAPAPLPSAAAGSEAAAAAPATVGSLGQSRLAPCGTARPAAAVSSGCHPSLAVCACHKEPPSQIAWHERAYWAASLVSRHAIFCLDLGLPLKAL